MAKLSWSKWSKYKILKRSADLASHLPDTRPMEESTLWDLLGKYGKVILKPSSSWGGSGVIQVSSKGNDQYKVHAESRKRTLSGKANLYDYVKKKLSRNYIVQRRIPLARVNGRPFDLRVMAQRRKHSNWGVTGKLAKVAGKGYIVTNIARSKGTVIPVESAIQRSALKGSSQKALLSKIDTVALRAAKRLSQSYSGIRTIGIDMGLDHRGKVWIIEANFAPATSLFRKLKNKSMYRKIIFYKKG